MISIIARHSLNDLPQASKGVIPVQLYGLGSLEKKAVSIGNPIIEPIRRLGIAIEPLTYDLLSLALAINAADTYINRDFTADAWTREIEINVEVLEKGSLDPLKEHLESMLRFLSGDIWKFKFAQSNVNPPVPYKGKRYKLNSLAGSDSVCLFSGGMDRKSVV